MKQDSDLRPISDSFKPVNDWMITAGVNTHGSESIPEGVLARTGWIEASVTGRVNRNKRLYERELWENVLNEERVKAKIEDAKGLLGELDHPDYFEERAKKAGIRTTAMRLNENDNMEIKFDILDTPAPGTGRVTYALVQAGVNLGVSSRGRGKLEKKQDGDEVYERVNPERYQFSTWDAVSGPGFATARVSQDQMDLNEAVQCIGDCDRDTIQTARKIYEDITDGLHREGECQIQGYSHEEQDDQTTQSVEEDSTLGKGDGDQQINESDVTVEEFQRLKNTVDELSDQISEKDSRIEELNETIEEKDNKIARLQGEDAEAELERLQEEKEQLEEKYEVATEALENLEEKNEVIKQLKDDNFTLEEKFDMACQVIEHQDEALDLASETIQEFKEHYLTACDVMEQWQFEDEEEDLRNYMESRCQKLDVDPANITTIIESAKSKQHFDRLLGDLFESQGRERPEPADEETITEGAQRYQSGPSKGPQDRTPDLDDVDEQIEEEDLEEQQVNEGNNGKGPDKQRLKDRIDRVGSKK